MSTSRRSRLVHRKIEPIESPAGHENWLELDRSPHAIHFYSGNEFLLDSLSRFVGSALESGDSSIVIATQEHQDGLEEGLRARGVDTRTASRNGRYIALDALQALAGLTVNGKLSGTLVDGFIRDVFLPLKAAAPTKRVTGCGEAVALLWAEGKADLAIEIEHLWNELAKEGCYHFRCFYPIASFSDPTQNELFLKLCAEHASVIPCEGQFRDVAAGVERFETLDNTIQ
jgi:MEDS: MEthanogen/methylotroph, DcmR Sensory domain